MNVRVREKGLRGFRNGKVVVTVSTGMKTVTGREGEVLVGLVVITVVVHVMMHFVTMVTGVVVVVIVPQLQ